MAHSFCRVLPYPTAADPDLKVVRGPFTDAQLEQITALGAERLRAAGEEVDTELRRARIVPLDHEPATAWIYSALGWAAQTVNGGGWQYELWGFWDPIQYTTYAAARADHCGWHHDQHDSPGHLPRKLSLVVLLSDETEYEGGDFEVFVDQSPQPIGVRTKGALIVFPSFVQHRVTPVTKGYRQSLVAFLVGPKFR
jgi:PKHD-type hydroxylase